MSGPDEIASLTAEVERLTAENERLAKAWEAKHEYQVKQSKNHAEYFDMSQRRIRELMAERDTLAARPEVQAMIAGAVAKEREACARMVDCGCDKGQKAAVIDAENGADRARACGQYNCGAEDAAAIRKRGEG